MFTVKEIIKAAGGKLIQGKSTGNLSSVSTNSKTVKRGSLFVPITGVKYDGHAFIGEARKRGAAAALTSKKNIDAPEGMIIIKVKDTLRALQNIARCHRLRFRIPVIGVTGSSGKTTTKDMIAAILSGKWKTLKSFENFNNEIGVPLTLLNLEKKHRAAVIEMAMQRSGEIDELAGIALPTAAVITNVGEAHLQFFSSRKEIARVKSEAFNYLKKNGFAVINSDDDFTGFFRKKAKGSRVITFGLGGSPDVRASEIKTLNSRTCFTLRYRSGSVKASIPVPGKHNVLNALAAAAACLCVGVSLKSVARGLSSFRLSSKRAEIKTAGGIRVINDCYNANPSSMKAALSMLSDQGPVRARRKPRRIAVLGDMLELGRSSRSLHRQVGRFAGRIGIDMVITKGYLSRDIAREAKRSGVKKVFATRSNVEALKKLKRVIRPNDIILIKGSRGMKMEEIAEKVLK